MVVVTDQEGGEREVEGREWNASYTFILESLSQSHFSLTVSNVLSMGLCCVVARRRSFITLPHFIFIRSLSLTFLPFSFSFLFNLLPAPFAPSGHTVGKTRVYSCGNCPYRKPDSTVGGDVSAPVALLLHRPHLVAGNWLFPDVRSADAENMAVSWTTSRTVVIRKITINFTRAARFDARNQGNQGVW